MLKKKICPFCIKDFNILDCCNQCEYKINHGICFDPDSDYRLITHATLENPIIGLIGIFKIDLKIKELFGGIK